MATMTKHLAVGSAATCTNPAATRARTVLQAPSLRRVHTAAHHCTSSASAGSQLAPQLDRRSLLAIAAGALLVPGASTFVLPQPAFAAGAQVYFDLKIDGEPAGRIVIELFDDVAAGSERFKSLAQGGQGVDYRLSKFNGVFPTYIRNDGLSKLSYSASQLSPIAEGDSIAKLEEEFSKQTRSHSQPGIVSLVVKEKEERPIKERLVAYGGKFITVKEQAGEAPNGTQFAITTAPTPELDATNLVIGQVVEGWDLIQRISELPVNKPRTDNPYFLAGKAMGDKRAVTAEKGFYRPFKKVVVSSAGLV